MGFGNWLGNIIPGTYFCGLFLLMNYGQNVSKV